MLIYSQVNCVPSNYSLKVLEQYDFKSSQLLKYINGLPFLHPVEVQEFFQNYLLSISLIEDERINKIIEYISKTYNTTDASLLPNRWAEYASTTNRTTKIYEAFHSKLNILFIASHPNNYYFIDILKNIQPETCIKIRSNSQRKSRQIMEK
jgi:hypothetical protein